MAKHPGPVLVDTNVILESFRIGGWRAFSGGYPVETVEDCVTETQTGFQRRRPEQLIDPSELRASMVCVHGVTDRDRDRLKVCSNDPVCADHEPDGRSGDRATHGAACHGCLLIAETSCEMRNLFLDRSLLVPTMGAHGSSFFG